MVKATPWPFYPRERPGTRCIGGLVGPRAGVENLASTGTRSLDRPACIESLHRIRRPGPPVGMHGCKWKFIILSETLVSHTLYCGGIPNMHKQAYTHTKGCR